MKYHNVSGALICLYILGGRDFAQIWELAIYKPLVPGHVYAAGGAGGEAEGGGEAVTGGNELHDCQEEGLGGRGQHRRESQ